MKLKVCFWLYYGKVKYRGQLFMTGHCLVYLVDLIPRNTYKFTINSTKCFNLDIFKIRHQWTTCRKFKKKKNLSRYSLRSLQKQKKKEICIFNLNLKNYANLLYLFQYFIFFILMLFLYLNVWGTQDLCELTLVSFSGRFPVLCTDHRQAHLALLINVGVIDFCLKSDLRRFEGILRWENDFDFECTFVIRRVILREQKKVLLQ